MSNTYIKNRGLTQTLIHNNNYNQFNQTNWDADYDGQMANISISTNTNGKKEYFDVSLDNEDLVNILSVPSINLPLEKRLKMDFNEGLFDENKSYLNNYDLPKLERTKEITSYLSSPLPEEELIVPISIINKNSKQPKKNHKTYRVYKKLKSHKPKSMSISNKFKKNSSIKPKLYSGKKINNFLTIL